MNRNTRISVMFSALLMFIAGMTMLSGCSMKKTAQVTINQKLISVSGNDAVSMADIFSQSGHIENIAVESDGSVLLSMTEDEIEWWKTKENSNLESIKAEIESAGCRLDYDEDHTYFSLYIAEDTDAASTVAWVTVPETYSALYQIFDHPEEDWYVKIFIYNFENSRLVVEGDSNSVLSWTQDDWAASYTDEWKAEYPENTVYIGFSADVLECFGQDRSSLKGFLESYSDYYLAVRSDPEAVTMAVDPEKMSDLLDFNRQLMEDEQEYFASLHDGYKINYNADSTAVELWYDDQISDDDIKREAIESFMLAVMDQAFRTGDGENWTLNVKIYNSVTGKLYENDTVPGETLYIIGQNGW